MSKVGRVYSGMSMINRNLKKNLILIMVKKLNLEVLSIEKTSLTLIIKPTNMSLNFHLV